MGAQRASSGKHRDRRVATPEPGPSPANGRLDVLNLQRTIGNQRTAALLVQRIKLEDMHSRSARMLEMANTAPEKGVNLWKATHESGGSVHLLGTHHSHHLGDVGDRASRQYLVDFLTSGNFTEVYTEMKEEVSSAKFEANLIDKAEEYVQKVRALTEAELGTDRMTTLKAKQALGNFQTNPLNQFAMLRTDNAYLSLAASKGTPRIGAFETGETKAAAGKQNREDLQIPEGDPDKRLYDPDANASGPDLGFMAGNQKQLFIDAANELGAGKDLLNAEERNRQYMDIFKQDFEKSKQVRQLWIIGASHLPGLILRFQDIGWTVEHQEPPPPKTEVQEQREPGKSPVGAVVGTGADEVD